MHTKNVLIGFASKYGATSEIASKIAEVLKANGFEVVLTDLNNYVYQENFDAVVVGSAVYAGNWRSEAVKFLQDNAGNLSKTKVWIFSSGPTGEGNAVEQMKGWLYPETIKPTIEKINPVETKLFHGELDVQKLNFFEKLIIKVMKAPQGDFRNWMEIEDWGNCIARELRK
jgi:menaquinone-dependent protoporphyrinogen oxidase